MGPLSFLLLLSFSFSSFLSPDDRVSCVPGWPWTPYVVEVGLQFLIPWLCFQVLGLQACTPDSLNGRKHLCQKMPYILLRTPRTFFGEGCQCTSKLCSLEVAGRLGVGEIEGIARGTTIRKEKVTLEGSIWEKVLGATSYQRHQDVLWTLESEPSLGGGATQLVFSVLQTKRPWS